MLIQKNLIFFGYSKTVHRRGSNTYLYCCLIRYNSWPNLEKVSKVVIMHFVPFMILLKLFLEQTA